MSEPEEEIYSTMFTSLKHPARRRILRMLAEKPMSFSRILDDLGISSSHLTYHLESLKELVSKTEDGTYRLSAFGDAAVSTMSKVEDSPMAPEKGFSSFPRAYKFALAVCMITIVVVGGLYYWTYQDQLTQINNLRTDITGLRSSLGELNSSYIELSNKYESAQNLLDQITHFDAALTNRYAANNSVYRSSPLSGSSSVFYPIYSLVNESELEIQFTADRPIPAGAYMTLWLAYEDPTLLDAENHSFFCQIWKVEATASMSFTVRLSSSGHYLLCVCAPENVPQEAFDVEIGPLGPNKLFTRIFTVPFTLTLRINYRGEYVSFLGFEVQKWELY